LRIYGQTLKQLWSAILTIASILGFAYLLNYSGVTYTLGLAFAATGVLFPFFASFIGWLGVALTVADTSSNALFANLQKVAAQQIGVSPQNIAVGTSARKLQGREGDLLRLVLKWSVALTLVMAIWVTLLAYLLKVYIL
jgi:lactate permease